MIDRYDYYMLHIKFVPVSDGRRVTYEGSLYCHFDVVYSELFYIYIYIYRGAKKCIHILRNVIYVLLLEVELNYGSSV